MSRNSKPDVLRSSGSLSNILTTSKCQINKPEKATSKVYLARKKLLAVINNLLKNCECASDKTSKDRKSYFLSIDQYNDAVWAEQVISEVYEKLKVRTTKKQFKKLFKSQSFSFDAKVKVNKFGKICIDTPILMQLIGLHNLLGDIIDFLQEMPREGFKFSNKEISSTPNSDITSSDCSDEKNQKSAEIFTKEILTSLSLPLNTNVMVMSANRNSKDNLPSLPEEKSSRSKITSDDETMVFTATTVNSHQKPEIVNAAGARKIIIKCMADLEKVRSFLEKDFSVQSVHIEKSGLHPVSQPAPNNISIQNVNSVLVEDPARNSHGTCCCLDNCTAEQPLEFTWKENGETGSRLVICIKGKTDEDGDIHVVIRQCPECLESKQNKEAEKDANDHSYEHNKQSLHSKSNFRDRSNSTVHYKDTVTHSVQNVSEHFMDPTSNQNINVIFDSENPSHSIVEGPNIRLHDTVNLNLITTTECNQDLVISLSVKPKETKSKSAINIDDIFSDSQASVNKTKVIVGHSNLKAAEKVIPIDRTKVCSSMEIDVNSVNSKLHSRKFHHNNTDVLLGLNDLGVCNVLRASRPVKCGRKAVLDESSNKNLPYSASLRSLPLDDVDVQIVNQSFNMSKDKVKDSKIFIRETYMELKSV